MMAELVLAAALLLAFVNGANDNMKGVATLYGSGALSYRKALALASASTILGSVASLALASGIVVAFSGKGLIPPLLLDSSVLAAVALGAAGTVLLATRLGMPISTTHALVGGLVGAGFVVAGAELNLGALGKAFMLPLVAGPVLATGLAFAMLQTGRGAARRLGKAGAGLQPMALGQGAVGLRARAAISTGHLLSASLVGVARGLNDTPKILGLVVGVSILSPVAGTLAITAAMAAGGLVAARRVTETLAKKITRLTPPQGLGANLSTSLLVIAASRFGLPVSTTHVSTGGIIGVGTAGSLEWRAVAEILAAWLTTLPLAAALAAAVMWGLL